MITFSDRKAGLFVMRLSSSLQRAALHRSIFCLKYTWEGKAVVDAARLGGSQLGVVILTKRDERAEIPFR